MNKKMLLMITSGLFFISFIAVINYVGCGGGGDTGSSFTPPPSNAPALTTNSATNITQISARLRGSVDPNGVNTNAYFQYGQSTSYGTNTSYQNVGSGNVAVNISEDITGLALNTQYNYRIRAIRSDGTFNGLNQTFSTIKPPPACTTNPATNVTNNSAKLNGLVNPNGLATDIYFEYGISATPIAYSLSTTAQTIGSGTSNVAVSATVSSLAIITQYDFRVVGINSTGTTYGDNRKFMTGNNSGSVPTCSTDSVTDITAESAVLYGTVNPNERDTIAYFEYGLTLAYGITTTNQSIGSGNINITVSGAIGSLTEDSLYNFRVVGTSSAGTSQGINMTFTTLRYTPICTTNDATNIAATTATLNGIVNPNGFNVTSCYFQYGLTQPAYGSTANVSPLPGSGTSGIPVSANISSLAPTTLYNFRVVAINTKGTTNGSNKTLSTNAIPVPTCTTNDATNITSVSAKLNGTVNPNGYNVTSCYFQYGLTQPAYGSTANVSPLPGSGTSNVTVSATASSLTLSTLYNFRLVAINAGGTTNGDNLQFTTTTFTPFTLTFNPTSTGRTGTIQSWTVTTTGIYQIEVWGAAGGDAPSYPGGRGARMRGDFNLTAGNVLQILVGQQGGSSQSSGGGGGSFVAQGTSYTNATALIIAGGGGGGRSSAWVGNGRDGDVGTSGTAGCYAGGTNGNGGARSPGGAGGYAGGGFLTNGGPDTGSGSSGAAFRNGGNGGLRQDNGSNLCADGGFGGGGGGMHSNNQGSGGGGGYSGGGAGHDQTPGPGYGGGGGSYNNGTNQSNTAGARTGAGLIVITFIGQ